MTEEMEAAATPGPAFHDGPGLFRVGWVKPGRRCAWNSACRTGSRSTQPFALFAGQLTHQTPNLPRDAGCPLIQMRLHPPNDCASHDGAIRDPCELFHMPRLRNPKPDADWRIA